MTSDYYMTKYHNILNVLYTQEVDRCTERGCRSNAVAWGRLDPIPLCYQDLHLFADIYHTVKSDVAFAQEAPHLESPKPISGHMQERRGATLDGKKRAREHLTSIDKLSLCVPLSHWYFEEMHSTVTRAPHSNTHDVIEVQSLQAADDAALGQTCSHARFCKLYFGSNNAERNPADTSVA